MATEKSTNSPTPKTKDLVNKNGEVTKLVEWATADVNSVDDMIALFGESGVAYSTGEEITGDYQLITGDEKQLFLERVKGKRTFCVQWEFRTPPGQNTREFVSVHVIIDGHGKFIVNDSAKGGFYGQLSQITSERISNGQGDREAKTGVLAARGFKANKPFFFDTRTNKAIPRSEMNNTEEYPMEFRQEAKPTWRLEF